MVKESTIIFQLHSPEVEKAFLSKNYSIEYLTGSDVDENLCAIYFSSNEIYYPNTTASFQYSILDRDKYEWKNNRLLRAHKHIFIRDIHKQWYLSGINIDINDPFKLFEFLKNETSGYIVYTIGSSAGGYAAILMGSLLNAHTVYAFNAQLNLNNIIKYSNANIDPILFDKAQDKIFHKYFDLSNYLNENTFFYYFQSANSKIDVDQLNSISINAQSFLKIIRFKTSNHGFPFLRINLPQLFAFDQLKLNSLTDQKFYPIYFSIQLIGLSPTFRFLILALTNRLFKKYLEYVHKNNISN
jgi:hypothetical protein